MTAVLSDAASSVQTGGGSPSSGKGWRSPAYFFLLPGFTVFSLVMIYPTVQAFVMSLEKWSPAPGVENTFVGLVN